MRILLLAAPLLLTSCEWFTDFKRQPSLWTWEPVKDTLTPSRGNPQMSVPTTGTAVAGFQVSYGAFPATIDSMAALKNPTPASDSSLANGRKYFQINCAVCHGDRAMGEHDPQRSRTDAAIQQNRRDGSLGRRELPERIAGGERKERSSGTTCSPWRDRRQGARSDQIGTDRASTVFQSAEPVERRSTGRGCCG